MRIVVILLILVLFVMPCSNKDNEDTMTMGGEEIEVSQPQQDDGGECNE